MLEIFVKAAVDIVTSFLKKRVPNAGPQLELSTGASGIERHLREALSWSGRMQFYGMANGEDTDAATIALNLKPEIRRFRSLNVSVSPRNERDLLCDPRNYLLLGDPGAGKTTTIKRLVRTILLDPPDSPNDHFQIPIVILLRELQSPLFPAIATAIGIPFEEQVRDVEGVRGIEATVVYRSANLPLDHIVVEFLNSAQVVLFLDGLDEVPASLRAEVKRDIESLARSSSGSKVIVSCRTGDYTALIEGFDLLQLCPLDNKQIAQIARAWSKDHEEFQAQLARVPYRDVADRPLLLTQLLFLFNRQGYLPEQPSEIYRKFVALLLQEWDNERGIIRVSKYSKFVPERKAAFLAALSHYLTYQIKQRVFTAAALEAAYLSIHDQFGLPAGESRQVVAEIETHTGIVAAAGPSSFEFAHLSLQEYLCAEYLVREPFSDLLNKYMLDYPAPVAVAVSLSLNPGAWLAGLVLRLRPRIPPEALQGFVTRLIVERPYFGVSTALGVAMLRLYRDMSAGDLATIEVLGGLLDMPNVLPSIDSGLVCYGRPSTLLEKPQFILLERLLSVQGLAEFPMPDVVLIPDQVLQIMAERGFHRAKTLLSSRGHPR